MESANPPFFLDPSPQEPYSGSDIVRVGICLYELVLW